ncbi:taspase, threonine aspartase, 1 [Linnemannia zychae]|nr:taspase, threonine aspartase, 1 [Linnemannia zychae]
MNATATVPPTSETTTGTVPQRPNIPSSQLSSWGGFVAVHVGAGRHAVANKSRYLDACKRACMNGIELLRQAQSDNITKISVNAATIVECMIKVLEDDPVTNAGIGSNLNLDGQVECDASLMDGTSLGFGSVDFKNPISVAAKILQESDQGPLSLGRIPPIMLVGPGVTQWVDTIVANSPDLSSSSSVSPLYTGLERVPRQPSIAALRQAQEMLKSHEILKKQDNNNVEKIGDGPIGGSLVTIEALDRHLRFQNMLLRAADKSPKTVELDNPIEVSKLPSEYQHDSKDDNEPLKRSRTNSTADPNSTLSELNVKRHCQTEKALETDDDLLQDTVGAICIDNQGRVAAGVSSGGIAMKFPGRVSEAALFGAGCWAQDATELTDGFACSLTGAGEHISKTLLARTWMDTCLIDDDISDATHQVLDKFLKSPLLRIYKDKHAGGIAVRVDRESLVDGGKGRAEFVFAHTTQTMV